MSSNDRNPDPNEAELSRVLRAAGRRLEPPEEMAREVRAALHDEWRSVVAERRQSRRRRWISLAAAASVAVIAAGVWLGRDTLSGLQPEVATVTRIAGTVRADAGWFARARMLAAGQKLHAGDEIIVDPNAGAALQLTNGAIVRLDSSTRVAFVSPQHLKTNFGAVYVDASAHGASPSPPLAVETPLGTVRHLGTQYEMRLADRHLHVSVREGRVELTGRDGIARTAESGERLILDTDGHLERHAVLRDAADWRWANVLAVPFAIENCPLEQFLSWVGRELGRDVVHVTHESEAEARRIILRGSVAQLEPEAALAAVLSTTRLRGSLAGNQIVIAIE